MAKLQIKHCCEWTISRHHWNTNLFRWMQSRTCLNYKSTCSTQRYKYWNTTKIWLPQTLQRNYVKCLIEVGKHINTYIRYECNVLSLFLLNCKVHSDLYKHNKLYIYIILYNILKIVELDCCQIILLSIYVPSTHA